MWASSAERRPRATQFDDALILVPSEVARNWMRKVTSRDFQPSTAAALYLRVSTEEQAREGVSLDAQEARVLADAAAHGLDVNVTYRDSGVSGSVPLGERPQGAELLAALDRGEVQHVLAFKLDRLFRDLVDCLRTVRQWDDAGTAMHLVDLGGQAVNTGSAVGRFFLGMLAGVAELERNLIAERTSAALRHKVARGSGWWRLPMAMRPRGTARLGCRCRRSKQCFVAFAH